LSVEKRAYSAALTGFFIVGKCRALFWISQLSIGDAREEFDQWDEIPSDASFVDTVLAQVRFHVQTDSKDK
jgi:hypothetical protein